MNSREKGARGERELAAVLKEYGYETRRGQQYCGANGDADVVGLPGIHIECKRVEKLNLYDAMSQSEHDAREDETPTVMHRKDRKPWLVTMTLDEWIRLYAAVNNKWHANSPVWHPPYGMMCEVRLFTGEQYIAELIKFNKYVNAPDRWRRPDEGLAKKDRWIDDDSVAEWREIKA